MRRLALVFLLAVILGGAFAAWQFKKNIEAANQQSRVNTMRAALTEMRGAIAKYHQDNGRYPSSLEDLVPKYLRRIPVDPMTRSVSWRLTTEETVRPSDDFSSTTAAKSESVVVDVHSSAPGYGEY